MLHIIEGRKDTATTAERIRVVIQQVYNYAIRKLLITTNPAQPLRVSITRPPVEHHRHLSEKELGAFWRAMQHLADHIERLAAGAEVIPLRA